MVLITHKYSVTHKGLINNMHYKFTMSSNNTSYIFLKTNAFTVLMMSTGPLAQDQ